ncbi:hypothetical protein [Aurantiacibacter gangjinensis]|uniref:hypothetical protein n=1 Tax=Aurantiacibacter gangjinensis TaxID=502682 RepID=UPI000A84FEDF|nr:hypothetical protein [Aurantiacibacter gangjinensis]
MPESAIILLVLTGAIALSVVAVLCANNVASRLARQTSGFEYWSISLVPLPTISVLYGSYVLLFASDCEPVPPDLIVFWHRDTVFNRFETAFWFYLFWPLYSLCIAIPTSMWFARRKQKN